MTDTLERIAQDFATFTRTVVTVDGGHNDLGQLIRSLARLAGRLSAAAESRSDTCMRPVLRDIALEAMNAVQANVVWVTQQRDCSDTREVVCRLTLAASQGWTAVDLLLRAYT